MGEYLINSTSIRYPLFVLMPPCCKGIHDYVPRMSDHLRDSPQREGKRRLRAWLSECEKGRTFMRNVPHLCSDVSGRRRVHLGRRTLPYLGRWG